MVSALFDRLEARWEGPATRRAASALLSAAFLLALVAIDLARRGLLPARVAAALPQSHFRAIELAFYLLLSYEVVGLVFGLARSVSSAAGKQLEIFSLILLRRSFEAFATLDEPLHWAQLRDHVPEMVSNGVGALAIFAVLGFYYRACRHRPAPSEPSDRRRFVAAKKSISLGLLGVFAAMAVRAVASQAARRPEPHVFFEDFYTLLIFADILIVLLSLRYSSIYEVVFRNSGLAVATVLLRLALAAPPFFNAALGLAAALFALGLSVAYNAFAPVAAEAASREKVAGP